MTANKSSTAVSREIQSSVYTQQKRKTNCKQLDYVATFFFQRFMVGVSTKRRVFQYLNNLSRPDQQDKMMAVNVPANNWDVHIRTCRRPRTMLTFLVELQRRSQWPQFKTAVQRFVCLHSCADRVIRKYFMQVPSWVKEKVLVREATGWYHLMLKRSG